MNRKLIQVILPVIKYNRIRCAVLVLFLVPALFSCSDSNVIISQADDDFPIFFSAGEESSVSRAVVNPTDNLNGQSMLLIGSAYLAGNNPDWTTHGLIKNLNGKRGTLTSTSASGIYNITYSPLAYYLAPNNYKYDFLGVYPYDHEGITIIPATSSTPFYVDVNLHKQPDVMLATQTGLTKNATTVPMGRLEHQLSQVSFNIKKLPEIASTVFLNEMKITGKIKARFNPVTKAWSNFINETGTVKYYGYNTPESFDVTVTPKDIRDIVVFPITATLTEYYEFVLDINGTKTVVRLPEAGSTWEPGKRYKYNFTVTDSNIYIEVNPDVEIEQEDWVEIPGAFPIT